MKKTFLLTTTWWPSVDRKAEVPAEYVEALTKRGLERAVAMAQEGFKSGELNDCVRLGIENEPENGVEFSGWWDVQEGAGNE